MNKTMIVCLFTVWLLTGCLSDPFGETSRAQIRADGAVGVAAQDRLAREAEARAIVDAEAERQYGQSHRTATWVMFAPLLILAVGAVVVVSLVVNWRGKIAFAREQRLTHISVSPLSHQIAPRTEYQMLRDYARSYGAELLFVGGKPAMRLPHTGQLLLIDREVTNG